MKYIGAHVSSNGGVENAPLNAREIGATAFALFVKNQMQWNAKPLSEKSIRGFKERCSECGYGPHQILPHDGYLINLANPEAGANTKSLDAFIEEIRRCDQLGLQYLNFHPGSHLGQLGDEEGLNLIASNLNKAIGETANVILVIEGTAGQGSHLGHRFEHLAYLIAHTENKKRIGVCLDTCHTFAAGYDLVGDYDGVFKAFDKIVGFKYLKGMHINDSKKALASRVDRHDSLDKGLIKIAFFKRLMQDKRFDGIPLILETPDPLLWPDEIKKLQEYAS